MIIKSALKEEIHLANNENWKKNTIKTRYLHKQSIVWKLDSVDTTYHDIRSNKQKTNG